MMYHYVFSEGDGVMASCLWCLYYGKIFIGCLRVSTLRPNVVLFSFLEWGKCHIDLETFNVGKILLYSLFLQ